MWRIWQWVQNPYFYKVQILWKGKKKIETIFHFVLTLADIQWLHGQEELASCSKNASFCPRSELEMSTSNQIGVQKRTKLCLRSHWMSPYSEIALTHCSPRLLSGGKSKIMRHNFGTYLLPPPLKLVLDAYDSYYIYDSLRGSHTLFSFVNGILNF